MVSGYNRNTTIYKNEFLWIGDTAIALWGDTSRSAVKGMGWDGTEGNQPSFSQISTTLFMSWESLRSSLLSTSRPSHVKITSRVTYSSMALLQGSTSMMGLEGEAM